mgnify:CR=1 FL=1
MTEICRRYRLTSDPVIAFDPEQREQLWKARKALYPTLYRFDPRKKPINFVDDVVVPAERIGELIRYLEEFFAGQRVPVAIFGHIGNGNAHIIPLLDVNDQDDFQKDGAGLSRDSPNRSWVASVARSVGSTGTAGCAPNTCGRCSARSCTTCLCA